MLVPMFMPHNLEVHFKSSFQTNKSFEAFEVDLFVYKMNSKEEKRRTRKILIDFVYFSWAQSFAFFHNALIISLIIY